MRFQAQRARETAATSKGKRPRWSSVFSLSAWQEWPRKRSYDRRLNMIAKTEIKMRLVMYTKKFTSLDFGLTFCSSSSDFRGTGCFDNSWGSGWRFDFVCNTIRSSGSAREETVESLWLRRSFFIVSIPSPVAFLASTFYFFFAFRLNSLTYGFKTIK